MIPTNAIPDHINFDGTPVFYPGTYSSGPDQGGEPWGICPPLNNYFDFIWLAHMLWKDSGDAGLFQERIAGRTLLERLDAAYAVPPADPQTGIVFTTRGTAGGGLYLLRPNLHDRPTADGHLGTLSGRASTGRDSRGARRRGIGSTIPPRRRVDSRARGTSLPEPR